MEEKHQLARAQRPTGNALTQQETTRLRAQAATKVLIPAGNHGLRDLDPIGFGYIASTPQVVSGDTSDWLIFPAVTDPLYQQGQLAAPSHVRARIRELRDAGVFFDALTIAHEVPAGAAATVTDGRELQRLLAPPTPKSLPVLAATVGMVFTGIGRVGKHAVRMQDRSARSLERLVVTLDNLKRLPRSLDPMIFGAVVVTPPATVGDAALYFLIASWDY
jgi:hypothetical protein